MKTRPQISIELCGRVFQLCIQAAETLLKRCLEAEREACTAGAFFAGHRTADRDDHVGPEALLEADRDCRLIVGVDLHATAKQRCYVLKLRNVDCVVGEGPAATSTIWR